MKKKITNLIFQNNMLHVSSILILFILLIAISCTKDNPKMSNGTEEFVGTYMARDMKIVEQAAKIDSMHFTVFEDLKYSIDFYESENSLDEVDFCNHSGTVLDFGTARAEFGPEIIINNHCDTLNIPRGVFSADFINHGDTIIISKRVTNNIVSIPYDSLYEIKLLK